MFKSPSPLLPTLLWHGFCTCISTRSQYQVFVCQSGTLLQPFASLEHQTETETETETGTETETETEAETKTETGTETGTGTGTAGEAAATAVAVTCPPSSVSWRLA